DLLALRIRQDREIAAADIEAHSTERDFVLVANDAADWLGVTFLTVGAKHAPLAARRHTAFELLDRRRVVLAENLSFRIHRQDKLDPMEKISITEAATFCRGFSSLQHQQPCAMLNRNPRPRSNRKQRRERASSLLRP